MIAWNPKYLKKVKKAVKRMMEGIKREKHYRIYQYIRKKKGRNK